MNPMNIENLSVTDFAKRVKSASVGELQLIDVREPSEAAIASIPGFTLLPLSQYEQWGETIHSQFECDRETWVLCHHGMRSAQMCQWLLAQGFTNVKNISGGIDAYSLQVDPSIARY